MQKRIVAAAPGQFQAQFLYATVGGSSQVIAARFEPHAVRGGIDIRFEAPRAADGAQRHRGWQMGNGNSHRPRPESGLRRAWRLVFVIVNDHDTQRLGGLGPDPGALLTRRLANALV